MGLGYAQLSKAFLRLIVCDISGYGNDGPYRDKKAYDLLIQSEAGLLSVTGTPDEPSKAGISIADIAAGMYAYSSILAALLQRQKTGHGSHVDVSMLEALGEWMGFPMYYAYDGAPPPPRSGASHATIYPYGPFAAGDGKNVMLGLQNEREWKVFCDKVLLQPELSTDPRFDRNSNRSAHRAELRAIILAAFSQLSAEQVIARLEEAQIANAHVNEVGAMWAHPQLQARGRVAQVDSPAGPLSALLPPGVHSGFDYRMDPVPAVGQHTEAILRELGRDAAAVGQLRAAGAI
jgi:crotonobetainyl-CoA:carnitine CoA-transferase CaiB-like acyl-CoA transferase